MSTSTLPAFIQTHPTLSKWIAFDNLPQVTVFSGKVELGQGIQTALEQIACQELGISLEQIDWVAGNTFFSPNEWYTAGSLSIENGGASLRCALGHARWLFIQAAAKSFGVEPHSIEIESGVFRYAGGSLTHTYASLASAVDLSQEIVTSPEIIASATQVKNTIVGQSIPRADLIPKLSGAAFIQDIMLPNMHHARMIRSTHTLSTISSIDVDAIKNLSGVEHIVLSGNFLAIVGKNEAALVAAVEKAKTFVTWDVPSFVCQEQETADLLSSLPATTSVAYEHGQAGRAVRTKTARYSRPFLAHASIGPACALAHINQGHLTVWSHTQGSHLLRDQIAKGLRQDPSTVDVIHLHGAGCYGHNSADDVAFDAAFIAKETGLPIRVQWSREEELTASPFGAPSMMEIEAGLDGDGRIVSWNTQVWSPTHIARPGWAGTINLLGAWTIEPPHPVDPVKDNPLPQGGGLRNAITLYDLPHQHLTHHMIPQTPLRTSALRSLGAYLNTYAIESFLDELAKDLDQDPIDLRISYLKDPRSIALLQEVARMANWKDRSNLPEGTGMGVGFGRYKNVGAYCAVIVQVRAEEKIYVEKVWCTADVGRIINPDGVLNQIEGGIIQSISWTLKEMVHWDKDGVTSNSWDTYPILMFDEVPEMEVKMLDQPNAPSLGGGEASAGPTGAAIANALVSALGIRARDLPLTTDRLAQMM